MANASSVILVIAAASGTGKSSLSRALVERCDNAVLSVSHTTRDKRRGEVDGEDYHFVSHDKFSEMIANDEFAEYACVYGHYYGTSTATIQRSAEARKNVILDIDWQGAMQVSEKFEEAVLAFLLPPSLQVLKRRLTLRGRDSENVIEQRFAASLEDLTHCAEFDYLILNDEFELALEELYGLLLRRKGHIRPIPEKILAELGIAG